MREEYFKLFVGYKSAMVQARILLERELITPKEFRVIETKMCQEFGINYGSLYRENDWINTNSRGNMSPTKGVI